MAITPTPSVLIDGALPRTAYDRCIALFEYLVNISEVGPHSDLDPGHVWMKHFASCKADSAVTNDEIWTTLEDKILEEINKKLPDDLVCTVGEWQPGDVIIREIGPDENGDLDDLPVVQPPGSDPTTTDLGWRDI